MVREMVTLCVQRLQALVQCSTDAFLLFNRKIDSLVGLLFLSYFPLHEWH